MAPFITAWQSAAVGVLSSADGKSMVALEDVSEKF